MSDGFLLIQNRKRYRPIQPQLTAMIDIFSLITVFLIAGTVFDTSSIILSKKMELPISGGSESIQAAPQVTIDLQGVRAGFLTKTYSTAIFSPAGDASADRAQALREISTFITKLGPKYQKSGARLNVVADKRVNYRALFDVVKVFRQSGFLYVHFVSRAEEKARDE